MDAIFRDLTKPQSDAVAHIDGPLLILAGPGSGKTRVVTHRIANMLDKGVPAWQIAALTFTNKAADEMRTRVNLLAPNQEVWLGTFHRYCSRLLRRYAPMVGLSENYSIYDTSDSKQAMKRAIELAGVSTSHTSPGEIAASISRAKNRLVSPEAMLQNTNRAEDTVASRVYPVYQQQLLTANAVDFDDLLYHIARLLRENPELRSELDRKFKYIMVDEYQDTNLAQYAIVRALSVDQPNLAVTGDPDQSIYGWRGADLNNILDFEKDYPNVATVRLEQNYRSSGKILRVADQLIRHNRRRKQKELFTENDEGVPVTLRMYQNGYQEADEIADEIATAIATEGIRASDVAIFCRMNALTRSLEHSLRNRTIPYLIVNGVEFYQRKEIKDLLAYLHLINNPSHDVALMRVINTPTRAIGAKTVERIRDFADQNQITMLESARHAKRIPQLAKRAVTAVAKFVMLYDRVAAKATAPLEEILRFLVSETKYEDYLERTAVEGQDNSTLGNVDELISAAAEFDRQNPDDASLEAFLEQVALVSDTDSIDGSTDRVMLMTMHAAKGLEFPRVYIIGVEDDLLPHARSKGTEKEIEEERRLLFVGITRAKQHLQLSFCKQRNVRGDNRPVIASPFLNELPREDMKFIETESPNEFFDDGFEEEDAVDVSYPESWDVEEVDVNDDGFGKKGDAGGGIEPELESVVDDSGPPHAGEPAFTPEEISQLPDEERVKPKKKRKPKLDLGAGLKTAADLLAAGTTPLTAFREGSVVRHPDYGDGTIESITGRGPKRTAKIEFNGRTQSFILAFADLELVKP